jgi:hypothetical protein
MAAAELAGLHTCIHPAADRRNEGTPKDALVSLWLGVHSSCLAPGLPAKIDCDLQHRICHLLHEAPIGRADFAHHKASGAILAATRRASEHAPAKPSRSPLVLILLRFAAITRLYRSPKSWPVLIRPVAILVTIFIEPMIAMLVKPSDAKRPHSTRENAMMRALFAAVI